MERIVVIGGNAAGMSAAARAKRLRPDLDITVVEACGHVSYSICGAPYYIGGQVDEVSSLVSFTPEEFLAQRGARVLNHTEALEIQPGLKKVLVRSRNSGQRDSLAYDRLLIATGYVPLRPDIEGLNHPRVFTLARLEDAIALRRLADAGDLREVLLLGGGYIGLELCEALRARGCGVTLVDHGETVLKYLDPDMSEIVAREVSSRGAQLRFHCQVGEIRSGAADGKVAVFLLPEEAWKEFDAIMIDIGVRPNVDLAQRAGLRLGSSGAIAASDRMESSLPGIYAAGNCAETMNLVSGCLEANFLGTAANKQGRVAGENMAGRVSRFPGVVGTSIVRVFDLAVGNTGLSARQALDLGFRAESVKISAPARARYFPDTPYLTLKIVLDRESTRLLGAQVIGSRGVSKRVDVLATCLSRRMTVEEVAQLDLSYAPAFSQVWDPIHVAMHAAQRLLYKK